MSRKFHTIPKEQAPRLFNPGAAHLSPSRSLEMFPLVALFGLGKDKRAG
jgi:hypothetical protein